MSQFYGNARFLYTIKINKLVHIKLSQPKKKIIKTFVRFYSDSLSIDSYLSVIA